MGPSGANPPRDEANSQPDPAYDHGMPKQELGRLVLSGALAESYSRLVGDHPVTPPESSPALDVAHGEERQEERDAKMEVQPGPSSRQTTKVKVKKTLILNNPSFRKLIITALKQSSTGWLTSAEVCDYIKTNYPERAEKPSWRSNVRRDLSKRRLFQKTGKNPAHYSVIATPVKDVPDSSVASELPARDGSTDGAEQEERNNEEIDGAEEEEQRQAQEEAEDLMLADEGRGELEVVMKSQELIDEQKRKGEEREKNLLEEERKAREGEREEARKQVLTDELKKAEEAEREQKLDEERRKEEEARKQKELNDEQKKEEAQRLEEQRRAREDPTYYDAELAMSYAKAINNMRYLPRLPAPPRPPKKQRAKPAPKVAAQNDGQEEDQPGPSNRDGAATNGEKNTPQSNQPAGGKKRGRPQKNQADISQQLQPDPHQQQEETDCSPYRLFFFPDTVEYFEVGVFKTSTLEPVNRAQLVGETLLMKYPRRGMFFGYFFRAQLLMAGSKKKCDAVKDELEAGTKTIAELGVVQAEPLEEDKDEQPSAPSDCVELEDQNPEPPKPGGKKRGRPKKLIPQEPGVPEAGEREIKEEPMDDEPYPEIAVMDTSMADGEENNEGRPSSSNSSTGRRSNRKAKQAAKYKMLEDVLDEEELQAEQLLLLGGSVDEDSQDHPIEDRPASSSPVVAARKQDAKRKKLTEDEADTFFPTEEPSFSEANPAKDKKKRKQKKDQGAGEAEDSEEAAAFARIEEKKRLAAEAMLALLPPSKEEREKRERERKLKEDEARNAPPSDDERSASPVAPSADRYKGEPHEDQQHQTSSNRSPPAGPSLPQRPSLPTTSFASALQSRPAYLKPALKKHRPFDPRKKSMLVETMHDGPRSQGTEWNAMSTFKPAEKVPESKIRAKKAAARAVHLHQQQHRTPVAPIHQGANQTAHAATDSGERKKSMSAEEWLARRREREEREWRAQKAQEEAARRAEIANQEAEQIEQETSERKPEQKIAGGDNHIIIEKSSKSSSSTHQHIIEKEANPVPAEPVLQQQPSSSTINSDEFAHSAAATARVAQLVAQVARPPLQNSHSTSCDDVIVLDDDQPTTSSRAAADPVVPCPRPDPHSKPDEHKPVHPRNAQTGQNELRPVLTHGDPGEVLQGAHQVPPGPPVQYPYSKRVPLLSTPIGALAQPATPVPVPPAVRTPLGASTTRPDPVTPRTFGAPVDTSWRNTRVAPPVLYPSSLHGASAPPAHVVGPPAEPVNIRIDFPLPPPVFFPRSTTIRAVAQPVHATPVPPVLRHDFSVPPPVMNDFSVPPPVVNDFSVPPPVVVAPPVAPTYPTSCPPPPTVSVEANHSGPRPVQGKQPVDPKLLLKFLTTPDGRDLVDKAHKAADHVNTENVLERLAAKDPSSFRKASINQIVSKKAPFAADLNLELVAAAVKAQEEKKTNHGGDTSAPWEQQTSQRAHAKQHSSYQPNGFSNGDESSSSRVQPLQPTLGGFGEQMPPQPARKPSLPFYNSDTRSPPNESSVSASSSSQLFDNSQNRKSSGSACWFPLDEQAASPASSSMRIEDRQNMHENSHEWPQPRNYQNYQGDAHRRDSLLSFSPHDTDMREKVTISADKNDWTDWKRKRAEDEARRQADLEREQEEKKMEERRRLEEIRENEEREERERKRVEEIRRREQEAEERRRDNEQRAKERDERERREKEDSERRDKSSRGHRSRSPQNRSHRRSDTQSHRGRDNRDGDGRQMSRCRRYEMSPVRDHSSMPRFRDYRNSPIRKPARSRSRDRKRSKSRSSEEKRRSGDRREKRSRSRSHDERRRSDDRRGQRRSRSPSARRSSSEQEDGRVGYWEKAAPRGKPGTSRGSKRSRSRSPDKEKSVSRRHETSRDPPRQSGWVPLHQDRPVEQQQNHSYWQPPPHPQQQVPGHFYATEDTGSAHQTAADAQRAYSSVPPPQDYRATHPSYVPYHARGQPVEQPIPPPSQTAAARSPSAPSQPSPPSADDDEYLEVLSAQLANFTQQLATTAQSVSDRQRQHQKANTDARREIKTEQDDEGYPDYVKDVTRRAEEGPSTSGQQWRPAFESHRSDRQRDDRTKHRQGESREGRPYASALPDPYEEGPDYWRAPPHVGVDNEEDTVALPNLWIPDIGLNKWPDEWPKHTYEEGTRTVVVYDCTVPIESLAQQVSRLAPLEEIRMQRGSFHLAHIRLRRHRDVSKIAGDGSKSVNEIKLFVDGVEKKFIVTKYMG